MIKAFSYMFKEFDFKKDLLPLWVMIFVAEFIINFAGLFSPIALFGKVTPVFYVLLLIGFVTILVPCGYGMECLKNYIILNEHKLAEICVKKNFIKGLKFMLSFGLLFLALFIIFAILGCINNLFIKLHLSPISFIMATFSCLILILSSFMFLASVCKFAKNEDLLSFVKLPTLYNIINSNVTKYFIGFIIFAVLMGIFCLLRIILIALLIQKGFLLMTIYSVLISILSTYFALVFLYLFKESVNTDLV